MRHEEFAAWLMREYGIDAHEDEETADRAVDRAIDYAAGGGEIPPWQLAAIWLRDGATP